MNMRLTSMANETKSNYYLARDSQLCQICLEPPEAVQKHPASDSRRDERSAPLLSLSHVDWSRVRAVLSTESISLATIARAGGLDPRQCFRSVKGFAGISLAGCDIRGVDFSKADLRGTCL